MGNKAFLAIVVFVALAAVFFLFGGTELFNGSGAGGDDPGGDSGAGLLTTDEDGTADADTSDAASRGPVLFGRSRAERVGVGSLSGRVMDFDTNKAIGQAVVVVTGKGYADETTAQQVASDDSGYFRFAKIAAGDAYSVHVTDPRRRERTVASVAVDADREKDLGVLWMGKASALEGVVLDAAGLPVADASVQVHEGGGSMMELIRNLPKVLEVMDKDAKPVAAATSERTGRFVIETLAPGPYTLVVRASGFQLLTRKIVMASAGAAGGKVTVRLALGQPIVGVVVDDDDRPVAGARVACMQKNDMESVFFGRQFSVTDSDGRFAIDSPPTQGALSVIVAAEGYPRLFTEAQPGTGDLRFVLVGGTEVLLRVLEKGTERPIEGARLMGMFAKTLRAAGSSMGFASGVTDHRGEALVMARPGKLQMLFLSHAERGSSMFNPMMGMMGQAMTLEGPKDTSVKGARTVLEFHLGVGVTVAGTVKDQEGKLLAGVRVSTMGIMGGGTTTTSDDEGRYELLNQSPPVVMVTAQAPGLVQVPTDGSSLAGLMQQPKDGVLTRDVVMRRAASITGRVVDAKGRPMPGVEVKIGGGAGMAALAAFTGGSKQTITNATGQYVLDGILPGPKQHVMARAHGYLATKSQTFEVGEGVVQAPDVVLMTGSRIVARVETPDGSAVREARVEVTVSASDRVAWDPFSGVMGFADVQTNAAGKADIENLPDGRVTLTATKQGFAAARVSVETKHAEGARHEAVLKLREAVTLSGRVVDQDGKPLKGAVVQSMGHAPAEPGAEAVFVPRTSATTDAQGRFELPNLPSTSVNLAATAEGHKPVTREVQADSRSIELRLDKVSDDVQARIKEIDAELMKIYAEFAAVKDEAERNALSQRMLQLQQEKAKLQTEGAEIDVGGGAGNGPVRRPGRR